MSYGYGFQPLLVTFSLAVQDGGWWRLGLFGHPSTGTVSPSLTKCRNVSRVGRLQWAGCDDPVMLCESRDLRVTWRSGHLPADWKVESFAMHWSDLVSRDRKPTADWSTLSWQTIMRYNDTTRSFHLAALDIIYVMSNFTFHNLKFTKICTINVLVSYNAMYCFVW